MAVLDLQNSATPAAYHCDIAIVGAGAVGIAMAVALARRGRDVLLLEAGGLSLEAQSQAILTNARSTGHRLDGLHAGRFRLLGGTTNFWGGQLVAFDPIVFEDRPWLGARRWPFDQRALRPFYDRAMSLVGMDGCESDDAAVWARARTSPPDFGEELELFLTRWTRTPNFARQFRADLAAPGPRVLIHANVTGLEPDAAGRRIARLHARTMTGRKAVVTARRTVLACGTVEIARLLMLPYADGAPTPWGDNPWLGRAYIDHLDSTAGQVRPLNNKMFHDLFENLFFDGYKYNPKIKLSEQAQRARQLAGVAASFIFRASYQEHAETIKLFLRSVRDGRLPPNPWRIPGHAVALSRIAIPFALRYLRENRTFHPAQAAILFRVTVEQVPTRDSRIRLRQPRDALDMPMVEVNWAIDGRELETIAYFAERVRDAMHRTGVADIDLDPRLLARDPAYLEGASDTYHQMGGARMGVDASDGVVDEQLAVFGIAGLHVAGAAVFPSTGFANCTLTAMALGLRLCDHLLREESPATVRECVS
jgi:choline dehydrogenase-like flavoprotein